MKKKLLVMFLISLAGVGLYLQLRPSPSSTPLQSTTPEAPAMALEVMTLKAHHATVYEELPGRTVAYKVAEIRPQVSGIITERLFEEGSFVDEGTPLYRIDPSLYQAELNSKLADLKKAEANVTSITIKNNRFKDLVKIDAISKQEYDDIQANLAQAEADVAIAEAAVQRARINLDYTLVYAPISGQIGKSSVTKGALVTANQSEPLATITQLDPMYVDMTQSSTELMQLRAKLESTETIPVELFLGDHKENVYNSEGKLQFHEVNVDQTTGSVQLRALFPNSNGTLLPGLFVRARLKLEYANTILLPQKVSQRSIDGNLTAWVMSSDHTINPVNIIAKKSTGDNWVVTDGLKEGDVVVTEGFIKLQPGMKIEPIMKEETLQEPAANEASPEPPVQTNSGE